MERKRCVQREVTDESQKHCSSMVINLSDQCVGWPGRIQLIVLTVHNTLTAPLHVRYSDRPLRPQRDRPCRKLHIHQVVHFQSEPKINTHQVEI